MNLDSGSIEASKKALVGGSRGILRICLETNGSMAIAILQETASLSLSSEGRIKFGVMEKRNQ